MIRCRKYKVTTYRYDKSKFYRNLVKDKDSKFHVSIAVWSKVIKDFNKMVAKKIIDENFEFKIPYRLGYLRIKKTAMPLNIRDGKLNTTGLKPDWKKTNLLWEKDLDARMKKKFIYHDNRHSDYYYYRWDWDRYTVQLKNQHFYMFKPSRKNKVTLAENIRNKCEYYK